MSGVGWQVWRRRMSVDRLLVGTVALSVLIGATAVAVVPRVVEHASARDVRHAIAATEPERRNVELALETRLPAGPDDPLGEIRSRGGAYLDAMPDVVEEVVAERSFVVDTPPFRVTSYPEGRAGPFTISFRFRLQDGIDGESELVEGRAPAPHDPIVDLVGCPDGDPDGDVNSASSPDAADGCERVDVPVIETVVTRQTAADMGVAVGDMVTLTPNQTDLRWQLSGAGDLRVVLSVVGLVELSDVDREYWYADNRLHRARITETADFRIVDATGLLAPEQYGDILRDVPLVPLDHAWRFYADPARFDVETADDVAIALANLELDPVVVDTGLPGLVDEFRRQRTIVLALLSTVVVGLGVVVTVAVGALARLLAIRRTGSTALVVARGADRRQLGVDSLRTALVVVVPPAAVGAALAWAAFRSTSWADSTVVLALFVVALVATVTVALRGRSDAAGGSVRRLVVDATVVVAAAAAVSTVRRRGDVSVDGVSELDPLLAATPSLVVVAFALLLVRAIPPTGRLLARGAHRARGAVALLGLRQLAARPAAARTATGVMAVSVGVAVFAAALHASISTARDASSWYDVGSEYTVTAFQPGAPLPGALAEIDQDGTARRAVVERAMVGLGRDTAPVDVVAIDAARYAAIIDDAPIDRPPLDLLTEGGGSAALVSAAWPPGRAPVVGDEVRIDVGGGEQPYRVASVVESFPAVRPGRPFVVVDLDGSIARSTAVHLDDDRFLGEIGEPSDVRLERRSDVVAELAADPLSAWTVRVLRSVAVAAGAFAALSAATALAVSVRARELDFAVLRTLGLDVRHGGALTVVEHAPALLIASIGGYASGAAAAWMLRPALGLARFAGPGRPVAIRIEPGATLATAGLVVLGMAVAVAGSIRVQRRRDLAATMRAGATT